MNNKKNVSSKYKKNKKVVKKQKKKSASNKNKTIIQKEKKKKNYVVYLVALVAIIIILRGITSAIFNYARIGDVNELVVGKIYMHYETSRYISLQNVEPRSTFDPNTYIEFNIDGLNEYPESDIWYAIDLLYGDIPTGKTEANRIRDDLLRFTLTKKVNNGNESVVIDNAGYDSINNLRMYVETIPAETQNELTHTYKLYMWITDEIKVGNKESVDYSITEWNNLFASIKIKVTGDFIPKNSSNSVRVNFDANGGSVSIPYKYYDIGSTYADLPIPEREDYTFDGWFYNDTLISSTDIVTREEEVMNFQARWTEIPGVAKIGNDYYLTLQEAISAVPTNNTEKTIVLLKNVNECVTVSARQNIVFNLRGNKVQTGCNNTIVTNNGTISIINGTFDGGKIPNAVINNNKSGKVTVGNGGRVVATGTRGAIYSTGGTVEVLEGAYLSASPTGTAGGRKLPRATINSFGSGSVTVTGGTIIGVNQEAIANEDSVLTIGVKDGVINRNSPVIMGGTYGVSVISTSTFNFYDGIIKGKTSGINNTLLITDKESDRELITSEETISEQKYVTQHLGVGITITFNSNEGSISENDASRSIEAGDKIGTLPTATKEGYILVGWFTESDNGVQITSETVVLKTTTFYAHWEENIVAEINGKEYQLLQDALDDIPTDNTPVTVTITKNMTEKVTVKANQNVVLDIGNNMIENPGDQAVITNNGTIEIVSGMVSSNAATNAAINNNANGKVIINGGRIITSADRGSIYNNGGIVEIKGNSYLSSTATGRATALTLDRGTINNFNNGTVIITGGTIVGINQQAISNENATLIIGEKDGSITTSTLTIIGKNYGVVNTGTFKFYDGTIKGITGAISGTITEQEVNSQVISGTEVIDESNYNIQYLQPSS